MNAFIFSNSGILYDSVIIVSHLEKIKDCANIQMSIDRNENESLSYINYGTKYNITSNKITTNNN